MDAQPCNERLYPRFAALEKIAGLKRPSDGLRILLFSRSGFSDDLTAAADTQMEIIDSMNS